MTGDSMPGEFTSRRVRLAYLVSHPIQYQAPLLRRIAREPEIDLTVFFGSDFSARGYRDKGFGIDVAWDTPLLEGYRSRVLPRLRDIGAVSPTSPLSRGILAALRSPDGSPAFDALWVHGYASVNALHGIAAAKALGIPVLLRAESWLADRPRSGLKLAAKTVFLWAVGQAVDAVLPIGTRNSAYWTAYFGADVPQFAMPYAVDNDFFAVRADVARLRLKSLRAELGIGAGRPVLLFASKLQARKHTGDLLEAYARLANADSPASDSRPYLVIVGDGEDRAALEASAQRLRLQDVRFAGFRNQGELPAFFALADLFVLPSRHEPWGLVVNEAMASGCPIIVSDEVGAAADLVRDGVEGFVFPAGDIAALHRTLDRALRLLSHDPDALRAMGEAARRRIATWDFEADVRGLRAALAAVTGKLPYPQLESPLPLPLQVS